MLFAARFHDGLRAGTIDRTIRAWSRPQVKVGGRYAIHGVGMLRVTSVAPVALADVDDDDARRSGFDDREHLVAELHRKSRRPVGATVYRIDFVHDGPDDRPDPGADGELTDIEVDDLDRRLDRMDARAAVGPWTAATLAAIAAGPGRRSADLALDLDRVQADLKADVRKLKRLGLTHSLGTGYRLSPRGAAYLSRSRR